MPPAATCLRRCGELLLGDELLVALEQDRLPVCLAAEASSCGEGAVNDLVEFQVSCQERKAGQRVSRDLSERALS